MNLLNEGGAIFMYPLLVLLIICIVLLFKSFAKGESNGKTKKLISSISLFALVWGFLGQIIGLIGAFDTIDMHGSVSPGILAGGLKIALLSPAFGMVVFLIARAGLIILTLKEK